jgi:hypothetical protein
LVPLEFQLWALLHDASEAYLVDIPRPLKVMPEFAPYRAAEKHLQTMIYAKYGLIGEEPAAVKAIDCSLALTEGRDLLGPQVRPWGLPCGLLEQTILPEAPKEVERLFLGMFRVRCPEALQ